MSPLVCMFVVFFGSLNYFHSSSKNNRSANYTSRSDVCNENIIANENLTTSDGNGGRVSMRNFVVSIWSYIDCFSSSKISEIWECICLFVHGFIWGFIKGFLGGIIWWLICPIFLFVNKGSRISPNRRRE